MLSRSSGPAARSAPTGQRSATGDARGQMSRSCTSACAPWRPSARTGAIGACLYILLRREVEGINRKRVYWLYRLEGLAIRRRTRKRVAPTVCVDVAPSGQPQEHLVLDFMQDVLANGRRFRALNILDTVMRECLAIKVDTSLPGAGRAGARPARQVARHPQVHHGGQWAGIRWTVARRLGVSAQSPPGLHRAWQAHAQWLSAELQWQISRRMPQPALVCQLSPGQADHRRLEGGVQYPTTTQRLSRADARRVCAGDLALLL